ncbi:MAG: type II secretion system GspH family protein [Elusimicrobiales bacterium]|nr:type II secretion system GspH family protein [Elusimicrobiales bacterium]
MKRSSGFTLIELIVVVLIMGMLASMGVPYYYKTVESSKASDSVAIGHLLGNANRMYNLDNPGAPVSGQVTNTCNAASCTTATGACRLVACNYVAQQDWNQSAYGYYVCNGNAGGPCCGSSGSEIGVSCTLHKPPASAPYSGWGYRFYSSGRCLELGGAPDCPKF